MCWSVDVRVAARVCGCEREGRGGVSLACHAKAVGWAAAMPPPVPLVPATSYSAARHDSLACCTERLGCCCFLSCCCCRGPQDGVKQDAIDLFSGGLPGWLGCGGPSERPSRACARAPSKQAHTPGQVRACVHMRPWHGRPPPLATRPGAMPMQQHARAHRSGGPSPSPLRSLALAHPNVPWAPGRPWILDPQAPTPWCLAPRSRSSRSRRPCCPSCWGCWPSRTECTGQRR